MFSSIRNHPFAVEAFFESSLVLSFATPKEELQHLVPACLELDTLDDTWAFVAIAMVQTEGLRPKGLPRIFGSDFRGVRLLFISLFLSIFFRHLLRYSCLPRENPFVCGAESVLRPQVK
jgi:hypothetical protein